MNAGDQYSFPEDRVRMQLGGPMKHFIFLLRANMRLRDPLRAADFPPILDHTGLTGEYSILVSHDPREEWPEILEHQLGLKLELRKEPVEVLIVDHAARPSAN